MKNTIIRVCDCIGYFVVLKLMLDFMQHFWFSDSCHIQY